MGSIPITRSILFIHSSSVVELSAVNRSVVGSNPTCGAMAPGQAVKTPPFHGGNTGSSPVGVIQTEVKYRFCFYYYILTWRVVRVGRRSTPGKCVGVTSVSRVRIPHSPLFAYTSLNLVKQNVDLTGFCYILLILVEPRKSDQTFLYIVELIKTSPQN